MSYPVPATLRCFAENWRIAGGARSGGQSLTGSEQFVAAPTGRWIAKASFHCVDEDDLLEAQGWIDGLDGQAGTFRIGPVDWRGRPWNVDPLTGGPITPDKAAASIEADPAYGTNPDTTGTLDFRLAASAALNATTISVQRNRGGPLRRGQILSFGDRMHRVVSAPVDTGAPGVVVLAIRPWLRASYAAGTVVEFAKPTCLMRLASLDTGSIDLTTSPISDFTLDLVEAF